MGNTSSYEKGTDYELFKSRFNWVTSYPMIEYPFYDVNIEEKNKSYIDMRLDCPPIIDIGIIPIHGIASVVSLLNYQLVKNKLKIFPPSKLFIYHNCKYFENVKKINIRYSENYKSL